MTDKDIQRLIDLAKDRLERSFTKEEALATLISAGILDENAEFAEPYKELEKLYG